MTAPFGTICTTALHSSPFLGYVFFCIMYFCIKVKHYNLPSDPKIQEGDGLWGGGVCVEEWPSTKGERLESVYIL